MSADDIPDELWRKILEMGVKSSTFSYKDLCCISISSRRLSRLSSDDSLWHLLLLLDYPTHISSTSSSQSPTKFIYRTRFEREKERKASAHRRALLRKESEISEWSRRIREMEARLSEESRRLQAASIEFSDLQRVRQASVALNVWQPQVVRGRQKQIVEQNAVPVEGRLRELEMEIKLCKQQIMGVNRAIREVKHRSDMAKKELESMKYHPLRDYKLKHSGDQVSNAKRKKLKGCVNCKFINISHVLVLPIYFSYHPELFSVSIFLEIYLFFEVQHNAILVEFYADMDCLKLYSSGHGAILLEPRWVV